MAEALTIARPYAEAVFRLARQQNALAAWSETLEFAEHVVADASVRRAMTDPNVTADELGRALLAIFGERASGEARNLVLLLVENRRLAVVPQIRQIYEELKAAQEGVKEARVVSAFPLSDAQLRELVARLEARFRSRIEASVAVDAELIGGVRVEVGDEVVDGSVRGQLEALGAALQK